MGRDKERDGEEDLHRSLTEVLILLFLAGRIKFDSLLCPQHAFPTLTLAKCLVTTYLNDLLFFVISGMPAMFFPNNCLDKNVFPK